MKVATEKKFEKVLQFSKIVPKEEFPFVRYHKKCRRIFVNVNKGKVYQSNTRSSSRVSRELDGILPNTCIFCNGQKYLPRQNTREKLLSCCQCRADETIRKAVTEKNDSIIMAITSDDIIAKEASYHASCYRNYTRVCYQKEKVSSVNEQQRDLTLTKMW